MSEAVSSVNPASIERVETIVVDLPTIRPHVLSVATLKGQTITIVKIRCSDGIIGVGEGTTIGGLSYSEESAEGIKLAIDSYFTPRLEGKAASSPAALTCEIFQTIVGNNCAKSAVETALWDAHGQRCGLPFSEFLGGRVRDTLPVIWGLASGDTSRDIEEAERKLDQRRHNAFKVKIGKRTVEEDIQHVASIKRALGERSSIRVDVNMAWSEYDARRGISMLADVGCELVEQPISRLNRAGMARLVNHSPIPIMADEAVRGPEDAFELARMHAADLFAVKIEPSGGPFAAKKVEAIAMAAGIGVYGGTLLEAGISTVASAHLFATTARLPFGTELFGPLLLSEDILQEPLNYGECALQVPTAPGLGVALDEDRVAFFRRNASRKTISIGLES